MGEVGQILKNDLVKSIITGVVTGVVTAIIISELKDTDTTIGRKLREHY